MFFPFYNPYHSCVESYKSLYSLKKKMYYIIGGVIVIIVLLKIKFTTNDSQRKKLIHEINTHLIKNIQWTHKEQTETLTFSPTTIARLPREYKNNNYNVMLSGFNIGLLVKHSDIFDIRKLHDPTY